MKFKKDDNVSLNDCEKYWEGYGFEDSTITKAWEKNGINKYSIKSHKGHTISIVKESELKIK